MLRWDLFVLGLCASETYAFHGSTDGLQIDFSSSTSEYVPCDFGWSGGSGHHALLLDGGADGGGGGGGGGKPRPQKPKPPNKKPCSTRVTTGQRVAAGVQGTLNVALGEGKTVIAGGVAVAGIAGAPETGGLSLAATVAAGYGVISSQGQVLSGIGNFTPHLVGIYLLGRGYNKREILWPAL